MKEEVKDESYFEVNQTEVEPNDCLFCRRRGYRNAIAALDHMKKEHGFRIPFEECVKDMEGLLGYLSRKVSGCLCLYCDTNKMFRSIRAIRDHMRSENHFRLRWTESDDDGLEYAEFGEFPVGNVEWDTAVGAVRLASGKVIYSRSGLVEESRTMGEDSTALTSSSAWGMRFGGGAIQRRHHLHQKQQYLIEGEGGEENEEKGKRLVRTGHDQQQKKGQVFMGSQAPPTSQIGRGDWKKFLALEKVAEKMKRGQEIKWQVASNPGLFHGY